MERFPTNPPWRFIQTNAVYIILYLPTQISADYRFLLLL